MVMVMVMEPLVSTGTLRRHLQNALIKTRATPNPGPGGHYAAIVTRRLFAQC